MKAIFKSTLGVAAAAMVVGTSVAGSISVMAWGDSNGGRPSYTKEQINQGVLGDKIVFNSISDGNDGDEKNFVAARTEGDTGLWKANTITVEEGKTYDISMYIHNNSPRGYNATAHNVVATFALGQNYDQKVSVEGYIDAAEANPTQYWDYVDFVSSNGQKFYLDYVEGSATMNYNEVDKDGNITKKNVVKSVSDKVITKSGINVGDVPGCYAFSRYVTIKVKPVFTDNNFTVEKTVRKSGEKDWVESVDAKVGDKVDYNIHYKNTTEGAVENAMFKDVLPTNMKIVSDVKLYNGANPNGLVKTGDIVKNGINIGGYAINGDAYIRYTAEVIDNNLICGKNTLRNWGQIGVGKITLQDSADVVVQKECKDNPTPTPETPEEKIDENTSKTATSTEATPGALPKTGPAEIATGIFGAGSIVTTAGYYLASRKQLR